jgi:hypothetical protein
MQQGRVQLDADWNEQAAILLHYMQTLAADTIGPHAGPAGHCGFDLITDLKAINRLEDPDGNELSLQQKTDLQSALKDSGMLIGAGHYYVNGLLCENEKYLGFIKQPGYPLAQSTPPEDLEKEGSFLVYLDVWERYISYLEDDSIREKALGGPDTAARTQVVWQVIAPPLAAKDQNNLRELVATLKAAHEKDKPEAKKKLNEFAEKVRKNFRELSNARLAAQIMPSEPSANPCIIAPNSAYRRAANQLYRVEIHKGGTTEDATFKWSRDNGSVATAWLHNEGNDLIVASTRGFAAEQWVELTHDALELSGKPGTLVKLVKVEGEALTIDPASTNGTTAWHRAYVNPKVRRWDHQATLETDGAVPVHEGMAKNDWIGLEDGLQIQFQTSAMHRTGDYWLIPARTATGNIEWPIDADGKPAPLSPQGIEHHYAPLAVIDIDNSGNIKNLVDCRRVIKNIVQ